MSSIAPTICALCDEPLNKDDIAGEHGACHACRTANTKPTLARVSLLLSLKDDLSRIPGWDIVREIAGNTYGHQRSDKELLERIVGCMQTITGKSRGAILVLPLERVASNLTCEVKGSTADAPQPVRESIEAIERKTPLLDTKSVEWIAACKKNEKKLGLPTGTLRKYRLDSSGGRTMPDKMFGMDRDGRRWRRQGTPTSNVYYFVPSLLKS